jgi:hypothetical protein
LLSWSRNFPLFKKPKVHYCVHNGLPPDTTLARWIQTYILIAQLFNWSHLSGSLFFLVSLTTVFRCNMYLSHAHYMSWPSHYNSFHCCSNNELRIQITKLLLMQFSPASCYWCLSNILKNGGSAVLFWGLVPLLRNFFTFPINSAGGYNNVKWNSDLSLSFADIWTLSQSQRINLLIWYDSILQSGNNTWLYTCLSLCLLLAQLPYSQLIQLLSVSLQYYAIAQ